MSKDKRVSVRWGIPALDDEGGLYVYGFMLRNYAQLGITRDEFLCVLHLAAYCYETRNGQSSPALATVAALMGYKHENSVRNLLTSLESKGMLTIERRTGETSVYNLHGFASRLLTLEFTPTSQCTTTPTSQCGTPLHPNVPEEVKEEEKKNNTTREKTPAHPLIEALRQGTGRYPKKQTWDKLIQDMAGLDPEHVKAIAIEWVSKGYNAANFNGIIKVARYGWDAPRNGNGHQTQPTIATPKRADLDAIAAETKRRMLAGEI